MAISTGDSVTIAYTGRLEDGSVFDTTDRDTAEEAGLLEQQPDREFEPLTVTVGEGNLIEGLESALLGLEEGASETITIPPEEAYGEVTGDRIREFDPEQFTEMVGQEPAEGMEVRAQGGAVGTVVDIGEDAVQVDFEHPLAGETLTFDVEVLNIE